METTIEHKIVKIDSAVKNVINDIPIINDFFKIDETTDTYEDKILAKGSISIATINLMANFNIDAISSLYEASYHEVLTILDKQIYDIISNKASDGAQLAFTKIPEMANDMKFAINSIGVLKDINDYNKFDGFTNEQFNDNNATLMNKYGTLNGTSLYLNPTLSEDNRDMLFINFKKGRLRFKYNPDDFILFEVVHTDEKVNVLTHCKCEISIGDIEVAKADIKKRYVKKK